MASPPPPKGPFNGPNDCRDFLRAVAAGAGLNWSETDGVQAMHGGIPNNDDEALDLLNAYACQSQDRANEVIENVAQIIGALLDRILDIPNLIHTNNMLYYRVRLMERAIDQADQIKTQLKSEQKTLLQLLAHMAQQVHRMVATMGLHYDSATNSLTSANNPKIDLKKLPPTHKFFGLVGEHLKQLFSVLSSTTSGEVMGQPLVLQSYPRITLQFSQATWNDNLAKVLPSQVAEAVAQQLTAMGGSSITAQSLEPYIRARKGSVIVTVQLTPKAEDDGLFKTISATNDAAEGRRLLQRALLQLAFNTPPDNAGSDLKTLYNNGLPNLYMPPGVTKDEPQADQLQGLLKEEFDYDLPDLSAPITGRAAAAGTAATGGRRLSRRLLVELPNVSDERAVWQAAYDAMPDAVRNVMNLNEFMAAAQQPLAASAAGAYYAGQFPHSAANAAARRYAQRRAPASAYGQRKWARDDDQWDDETDTDDEDNYGDDDHAHDAHGAGASAVYVALYGGQMSLAINLDAVLAEVKKKGANAAQVEGLRDKEAFLTRLKENVKASSLLGEAALKELVVKDDANDDDVAEGGGVAPPPPPESDREVVAGVDSVELNAETVAKSEMLAKIKAMAESSDVKEFVRVRPYVDKDLRATELQLGTIDQEYDRSPDPAVVQGQLATRVAYKGECLDFTDVFKQKDASDVYFARFKRFIPNSKTPPASAWFSTVNGGVFFEPESYKDVKRLEDGQGLKMVATDMLKVRKKVAADVEYQWVKADGTPTDNEDPDKARVVPKTSRAATLKQLQPQLGSVSAFGELYRRWTDERTERRKAIEEVMKETSDASKKAAMKRELDSLPEASEHAFLDEYYRTRVISEAINTEFVDTTWPVLRIFFGMPLPDGTTDTDNTKNVVAFFYGASGSGKTFTAEAILDKVFESIRSHPDEFQLKLLVDYNDNLYDYYSPLANARLLEIDNILATTNYAGVNIGERMMMKARFEEMAYRAKFLGWQPSSGGAPPETFFEGNPNGKVKLPANVSLNQLRTFSTTWQRYTPADAAKPGKTQSDFDSLKTSKGKNYNIPKDNDGFRAFQADLRRRVENFRSVTDTGLNPESSRSHLLYVVQRVTKNGQPMDPKERGAQFILADFAGTEDLNYLMTAGAWKKWKDWKAHAAHGGVGDCVVAGRKVTGDWACLDLPAFAKSSKVSANNREEQKEFKAALEDGWRNIKVKTLVSKEISENPAPPKDLKPYRDALEKKWRANMNRSFATTGEFAEKHALFFFNESDLANLDTLATLNSAGLAPEQAAQAERRVRDALAALAEKFKNSAGKFSAADAKKKGFIEDNPYRLSSKDVENSEAIVNMVLAMHAESRHINDSLHEITTLVQAQRKAIEKGGPTAKADVPSLGLKKRIVIDVLTDAITAGSSVVTIGAMNPRRANDFDTYNTMVNITEMNNSCKSSPR